MRRLVVAFFFCVVLPATASAAILLRTPQAASGQASEKKTILSGVYTAAQATRGKESFAMQCGSCHAEDLSGLSAPALKGAQFLDNWREYSLSVLHTYIKENMPRGKDKLTEENYTDILTYMLERNDYPAGASELKPNGMDSIAFVGKNGPAQVPEYALIQVVGCLTQGPDGIWLLTSSSDPIRIRNEQKPTQEELSASAARRLGNQTFRLVYPDFEPGFDLNSHKGHKMEGKGYFLTNPVDQRLSVVWMGRVRDGCD